MARRNADPAPLARPTAPLSLWSALVDLVAVKECAGCGGQPLRRSPLCGRCLHVLTGSPRPRQAVLDARGAPRTFAAGHYEDPLRTMLICYKERGRTDLRDPLAVALASAVEPSLAGVRGPLILVPMPSTRRAVRQRGADTTAQLGQAAARVLTLAAAGPAGPAVTVRSIQALRHSRRVADQAGLDRAERAANLAGALRTAGRWRRDLAGADVVLIDDIATSGATLAEAARAVRAGGARVVGAATVAAARLRA
jgi:predicted amidophosphoribosyltransferase